MALILFSLFFFFLPMACMKIHVKQEKYYKSELQILKEYVTLKIVKVKFIVSLGLYTVTW